jgi:hypothetical protein
LLVEERKQSVKGVYRIQRAAAGNGLSQQSCDKCQHLAVPCNYADKHCRRKGHQPRPIWNLPGVYVSASICSLCRLDRPPPGQPHPINAVLVQESSRPPPPAVVSPLFAQPRSPPAHFLPSPTLLRHPSTQAPRHPGPRPGSHRPDLLRPPHLSNTH